MFKVNLFYKQQRNSTQTSFDERKLSTYLDSVDAAIRLKLCADVYVGGGALDSVWNPLSSRMFRHWQAPAHRQDAIDSIARLGSQHDACYFVDSSVACLLCCLLDWNTNRHLEKSKLNHGWLLLTLFFFLSFFLSFFFFRMVLVVVVVVGFGSGAVSYTHLTLPTMAVV